MCKKKKKFKMINGKKKKKKPNILISATYQRYSIVIVTLSLLIVKYFITKKWGIRL